MEAGMQVFLMIIMIFRGSFLKKGMLLKPSSGGFKKISSKNKYPLGSTICPSYVLHAVAAIFRADADIHFPDCF